MILKTQYKEVKVKPMSHYELRHLYLLATINPTNFGGSNHLISSVQRQVIIRMDEYTPTTSISANREIKKKQAYWKMKINTNKSIETRKMHQIRPW